MLTQERYGLILKLLAQRKTVTVGELTEVTAASEATVRRDLTALQKQGRLTKLHGGAALPNPAFDSHEEDVPTKAVRNVAAKAAIGRYAAALITDDDFIYLDAGTTTGAVIDHLGRTGATFVTNGLEHIRRLTAKGLRCYLLGGQFKAATEAIIGTQAIRGLEQFNFTKCFIGANGIAIDCGFTTPDAEEAAVKTAAMARSYVPYILADGSKFGKVSSVAFAPLGKSCVITDSLTDESYRELAIIKEVAPCSTR